MFNNCNTTHAVELITKHNNTSNVMLALRNDVITRVHNIGVSGHHVIYSQLMGDMNFQRCLDIMDPDYHQDIGAAMIAYDFALSMIEKAMK